MSVSCNRAARLSLASVGGHATAAERLELEAHLAGCARCGVEHAALGAVRAGLDSEPAGLGAAARERVLRAARTAPARAPHARRRLLWPVGAAAALVAVAAVALWMNVGGGDHRHRRDDVAAIGPVSGDVVVVRAPASVVPAAESAGDDQRGQRGDHGDDFDLTLRSRAGGGAQLDDASAELAQATEILWRRSRRSVELRAGAVTIDVQHRPGQRFQVLTPRFVVDVVGTRFAVDLSGVRTERGKVRVLSPAGDLLAYVEAGQSWSVPVAAAAPAAPAAPAPIAAPALAPPASTPPAPAVSAESAIAARLARARRALARGDAAEARRAAEPVFRASRDVAAEARVIHAESYLIEGRHADAIEGYELVVRDFPGTPQAESALFAIAQLESEHGRGEGARATLRRYLARYPRGRFAKEAADRLAGLPAQPK